MQHTDKYFAEMPRVVYGGTHTASAFQYRYYDAEKIVLGKTMAEQLRLSVCCWHSFAWQGGDTFGGNTFDRPWLPPQSSGGLSAIDAAFEFALTLGVPFLSFHDEDLLAFNHASPRDYFNAFQSISDYVQQKIDQTGIGVLLATANLFSHASFAAGAATSPNPEVFAFAAAKVKNMMDSAKQMDAQNYVLWGGRDGYNQLLNTSLSRELDQLGRFVALTVEHKHKIGYRGSILIEPKPCEPTKHQYDYDVATVYGFLAKYDLLDEVKVNVEANHATLAGHSFAHEVAYAAALGLLGSIDANRGDPQNGWDTDQFPNDISELSHVLYLLISNGGFDRGGFNFDAKLRRGSTDLSDLLVAHIAGIDALAKSLCVAEKLIQDHFIAEAIQQRYQAWNQPSHPVVSGALADLDALYDYTCSHPHVPISVSDQQEMLEAGYSRYIW